MRDLIDLEPTLYRDTYHLTATGKSIYTKRFCRGPGAHAANIRQIRAPCRYCHRRNIRQRSCCITIFEEIAEEGHLSATLKKRLLGCLNAGEILAYVNIEQPSSYPSRDSATRGLQRLVRT